MIDSLSKTQWYIGVLIAACFGAAIHATQVIPNPVNPQIGENLWQMNYRESITLDDIMDTTTLCCNCDFFITQADIDGNGGGFTITQSGNWCLGENIITSQPITIANISGVVFDLKGRTISSSVKGNVSLPTGIIDVTNSPSTIIKNGYLIGLDLTPPVDRRSGVRFYQSDGSIVQNVQAQFFGTVDDPAIFEGNFAFFANFSNYVQFLDCFATGPFLAGFTIFGSNGFVKNCAVSHFSGYVVPGPLTADGVGFWLEGTNNYATNCISSGGAAQPTSSSSGSIGFLLQGNNNAVNECTALNHKLNAHPSFNVDAGSGFSVRGDNCQISNCTSAYNEGFGIINTGIGLVVCNNLVHDNGTNLSGVADSNICTLLSAASGCDFTITQADIGNGGIYTITQPGKYCLTETVSYSTSSAITISSDNVVLNLNSHPMIRTTKNSNPGTSGAIVCNGRNCTIQNGELTDSLITTGQDTLVENITIRGTSLNNTAGFVVAKNSGFFSIIKDCTAIGLETGFFIDSTECVLSNCIANEMGTVVSGVLTGTGFVITGDGCLVENCATNLARTGFYITGRNSLLTKNFANNCSKYGFLVDNIIAHANFLSCVPTSLGTWTLVNSDGNPCGVPLPDNRGIRLANNIAANCPAPNSDWHFPTNGPGGFIMRGVVWDNIPSTACGDVFSICCCGSVNFETVIWAPIGAVNRSNGILFPYTLPALGTMTGPTTPAVGIVGAAIDGNLQMN